MAHGNEKGQCKAPWRGWKEYKHIAQRHNWLIVYIWLVMRAAQIFDKKPFPKRS